MKKSLLIGVATVALIGVSATLFAQTATGSSVIAEMKAAARSFTLKADLNSGSTANLQSSPVTGKETGDMLTAGEWNRVLELVAQGGGGVGSGAGWVDISLTGTDEFNEACFYRMQAGSTGWNYAWQVYRTSLWFKVSTNSDDRIASVPSSEKGYWDYYTNGNTTNILQNNVMSVQKIQQMCGGTGGGGGGSSWSDVPLTDTGDFDMTCTYRATLNIANDTISRTWHGSDVIVIYPDGVGPKYLSFLKQDASYFGIRNTNKNVYGSRNGSTGVYTPSTTVTVTKIEKDC